MVKIRRDNADVLIIGSGGAGLRAAIELSDNNVSVLVVGKSKKRDAHTIMATGGINAALGNMDPKDNWKIHAADTIRDGGYINDPLAVKVLCKNASRAVNELATWGVRFNRENGMISQRFFGAATYRRACFIGDHTGMEILNVLVDEVEKRKIKFSSEVYIFSLLQHKGKVNGAIGMDCRKGEIVVYNAKIVVLATGGHSKLFSRSSSRFWENNGDGIYLAYNAGCKFMDMEMFQFHPTGMVWPPEAIGTLVTEAVRGEGGILTNAKGERFMKKYDPKKLELAARDIVARAIHMEINSGRGTKNGGVWLDISHKSKGYILKRLPSLYKQFKKYLNLDISKQKMEVAPTAHYSMGGIFIDNETGKTGIPNLFAIGEVTSGIHGSNRLGGNSLAEIIVFGKLTGRSILKELKKLKLVPLDEKLVNHKKEELLGKLRVKGQDPIKFKESIQNLMWNKVGVIRNKKDMTNALEKLSKYKKIPLKTGNSLKKNMSLIAALDVQNMFHACEMIIKSALFRKESRGAHYRSDYKTILDKFKRNVICTPTKGKGFKISTRSVPKIPKEIKKVLDMKGTPKGHLLE